MHQSHSNQKRCRLWKFVIGLAAVVLMTSVGLSGPTAVQAAPGITNPTPGSTLTTTTVTFTGGHESAEEGHWAYVGSTPGGKDFRSVGPDANHEFTVSGLPSTGTIYVKYYTRPNFESDFESQISSYTMAVRGGGAAAHADLASDHDDLDQKLDQVLAQPTKDVNVVNEPNVNVLNHVAVNVTNDTANPVPVVVQNEAPPAPVKELVEITAERTESTPTVVYTVPTGKRLVITDINIVSGGSAGFRSILRNTVTISSTWSTNSGLGNYQRSYLSGIQFNESDTVGVSGASTFFELRGYLTDMN